MGAADGRPLVDRVVARSLVLRGRGEPVPGSRKPEPAHTGDPAHAVLVGFVMFLILGVALWLFPRAPKGDTRYSPGRAEASYWILLVATLGRFLAEAARAWVDAHLLGWIVVAGGLGHIAGLALYFWTMWSRVRPVGSHIREAKGERF